jgi:hypothetical protein
MSDSFKGMAKELKPFSPRDPLALYLFKWIFFSSLILVVSYYFIPTRADLGFILKDFQYQLENILWLSLSLTATIGLYQNFSPEGSGKDTLTLAAFILGLLLFSALSHEGSHESLATEMELWRGGCGFIIMGFAVIHGIILLFFSKSGAPASPALSGIWSALAASSLACLVMQILCAQDSSLHLMLWHFLPLSAGSFLSSMAAKKVLKW